MSLSGRMRFICNQIDSISRSAKRRLNTSYCCGLISEERHKNGPSLAEIRERALQIHVERGGDGCGLENYLDDWLEAERELQEKYNKGSGE